MTNFETLVIPISVVIAGMFSAIFMTYRVTYSYSKANAKLDELCTVLDQIKASMECLQVELNTIRIRQEVLKTEIEFLKQQIQHLGAQHGRS